MKFDSPIEDLMYAGLRGLLGCEEGRGDLGVNRPTAFVFPQYEIGPYRVDFLVVVAGPDMPERYQLIIECDGQEFHSGSEQRRRDRVRERELYDLGYREIIRFSGTEIYRSLHDCLAEVRFRLERFGVVCQVDDLWPISWPQLGEQVSRERWRERDRYWNALEEQRGIGAWRDGEPDDRELYGEAAE